MGIHRMPTVKSYFSKNFLFDTPVFYKYMSQDRYELPSRFLHFVNNDELEIFEGNKKLFKIDPILKHLKSKFSSLYRLKENISLDESLTLWKGRLGFKQYIPLKAAKFGIKSFELCASSSGYLWNFIIYSGITTDLNSSVVPADNLKTTQIVIKLVEPLFGRGHTLWMDNFYNSPDLCLLLKKSGVNVAGTLRLSRKNVPLVVKETKLKRGEHIAVQSQGVMVLKWMDKKPVSFISTFHSDTMVEVSKRGKVLYKPRGVQEYNSFMGGVDLKDQKLQPYEIERKRSTKWYTKLFKRLLNISVHNAFVLYRESQNVKQLSHLDFRLQIIKELFEVHGKNLEPPRLGRPSKTPMPGRLTARHFVERIPPSEKKAKPTKRCAVCCKTSGKRKETSFWCRDCGVGLGFEECFRIYHTQATF
jgi:hypothetical protein